jgi:hypothetical protein
MRVAAIRAGVEIRGFEVFSVRVGKEICRRLNRPEA